MMTATRQKPALDSWNRLVNSIRTGENCDHLTAVRRAVARGPALYKMMLAEANADQLGALHPAQALRPQPMATHGPAAISAFNDEVQTRVDQGMAKPAAIRAVVHAHPELHAEYLRAYNSQHNRPCSA